MPPNRPPFFNPQRRPNPEKQTRRRGSDPSCPSHRSATKTRASLIYARPMYFSHALIRLVCRAGVMLKSAELFRYSGSHVSWSAGARSVRQATQLRVSAL